MKSFIWLAVFFSICGDVQSSPWSFATFSSCVDLCRCSRDSSGRAVAKCSLPKPLNNTIDTFQLPKDLYSLDLSNCGLTAVPRKMLQNLSSLTELILDKNRIKNLTSTDFQGLANLKRLSLEENSIHTIYHSTFAELKHLQDLNLGMNDLRSWRGNFTADFPVLQKIEITNAIFWIPDERLLKIGSLKEIIGAVWCKFCKNCTLVKPPNLTNNTARKEYAHKCLKRLHQMNFLQIGKKDAKRFVSHGFVPECMCIRQSDCEFRQLIMPHFIHKTSLPQHLFYIEYAVGPFTILFNFIVLVTILVSKNLRKFSSFILIANMAFVDMLIGVYAISVAHNNIFHIKSILEEIMFTGKQLSPSTGPIFIAGQLVLVSVSLLLTVERYTAVVYCVSSKVKMTTKLTLFWLLFVWFFAGTFAILPIFNVGGLRYNIERACAPLSYDPQFDNRSTYILLTFLAFIIVLYIANVPLYAGIYRFVKNASNQVRVKREVSLAKKIALLILTNFLFFAIPIVFIFVVSVFALLDDNPFDFDGDALQSTIFKIVIGQWLPVTCLNINSFLDPFLYAFRHTHFKRELKKLLPRKLAQVVPAEGSTLNSVNEYSKSRNTSKKVPSSKKMVENTLT